MILISNNTSKINFLITFLFAIVFTQQLRGQELKVRQNDTTSHFIMLEPQNNLYNTFLGTRAGSKSMDCCNTFLGYDAGSNNSTGYGNTFLGYSAGLKNKIGYQNTFVGFNTGYYNTGSNNLFLGFGAGLNSTGSNNVFIGPFAGESENNNDVLIIGNASTGNNPLIKGSFADKHLLLNGRMAINRDLPLVTLSLRKQDNHNYLIYGDGMNNDQIFSVDNEGGTYISKSLGIGKVIPDKDIHIYKDVDPTILLQSNGVSEPSGRLSMRQSNLTGADIYYDGADDYLAFETFLSGASEGKMMAIDLYGNIGIGTTDPLSNLHIKSDGDAILIIEADSDNENEDDNPLIEFRQDNGGTKASIGFHELILGANRFGVITENDSPALIFSTSGNVAIGANDFASGYKLSVSGKVATTEVRVQPTGDWPDYVFAPAYPLMTIPQLKESIIQNQHLPGIPSASEVYEEGIMVGDMQKRMLEKIEELTLYIIQLSEKIEDLEEKVKVQDKTISDLKN